MEPKPTIIVILGPTASGKTAFAISLAQAIDGEVISADSRQVYRGLNLGTGKVTKKEMVGVRHHLLDVASPKHIYTASDYVLAASKAIADITTRGKVPVICGGTGFYIDTLLGRMHIPEVPPNPTLRKKLANKSVEQMYALLIKKDPERAASIDKHNPVRLIRALEIINALGKVPAQPAADIYNPLIIGLSVSKEQLAKQIHTRLHTRMKQGMLREAKKLHIQGLSWKRMEDLGLEYRYMARHLQGKLSKPEMLLQLESEINKYSKRQMTWFKRHKDVVWLKPSEISKAVSLGKKFLGK